MSHQSFKPRFVTHRQAIKAQTATNGGLWIRSKVVAAWDVLCYIRSDFVA
jgi:hypothetical protein